MYVANYDYASTIWNPYQLGVIRELENVQRRATKLIPTLRDLPYSERLQTLTYPVYLTTETVWT